MDAEPPPICALRTFEVDPSKNKQTRLRNGVELKDYPEALEDHGKGRFTCKYFYAESSRIPTAADAAHVNKLQGSIWYIPTTQSVWILDADGDWVEERSKSDHTTVSHPLLTNRQLVSPPHVFPHQYDWEISSKAWRQKQMTRPLKNVSASFKRKMGTTFTASVKHRGASVPARLKRKREPDESEFHAHQLESTVSVPSVKVEDVLSQRQERPERSHHKSKQKYEYITDDSEDEAPLDYGPVLVVSERTRGAKRRRIEGGTPMAQMKEEPVDDVYLGGDSAPHDRSHSNKETNAPGIVTSTIVDLTHESASITTHRPAMASEFMELPGGQTSKSNLGRSASTSVDSGLAPTVSPRKRSAAQSTSSNAAAGASTSFPLASLSPDADGEIKTNITTETTSASPHWKRWQSDLTLVGLSPWQDPFYGWGRTMPPPGVNPNPNYNINLQTTTTTTIHHHAAGSITKPSTSSASTFFTRHPTHWYHDGSVLLQLSSIRFKLHFSRMAKISHRLARIFFDARDVSEGSVRLHDNTEGDGGSFLMVYVLDGIGVHVEDFVKLLDVLEDPLTMLPSYAKPTFGTLAAILRAATKLDCPAYIQWATRTLEDIWDPSIDKIKTHIPGATDAVALSKECGIRSVYIRAMYELVRGDQNSGDELINDKNKNNHSKDTAEDERRLAVLLAEARLALTDRWTAIISSPLKHSAPCPQTQADFESKSVFYPCPAASGSPALEKEWHTKLVHISGIARKFTETADPLGGLQLLRDEVRWAEAGYCDVCFGAMRQSWRKEAEEIYASLGALFEL